MIWPTLLLASLVSAAPKNKEDEDDKDSGTVWVTPHDSYSSSVGVLGCKIDTDRVAYWPASVDCTNICVSLSYEGRDVKLRLDTSRRSAFVIFRQTDVLKYFAELLTKCI